MLFRHNVPLESVMPSEQEAQSIKELERILKEQGSQVKLLGANGEQIAIPKCIYQLWQQVVHAIALGQELSIVTQERELTTQQAADFLNVSRPYLIKLLKQGEIPYIQVGSHRRVNFDDLTKYKQQRDEKRKQGLKELTQFLEEEGFYDEEASELNQ
ncbi:DNA-binding protein [Nostoc sp. T09]|uniref:helix-turn-helix domain-containing protein n=1 Tax=Nostoc sp. T09 TaxID=1932621 RepID=UPI000B70F35C|nr:helix-turn-helix domain-containing protein [Nostoc sp. T09]OUL17414.1 DNA-binding protein [Nostoc sp. T09]